MAKLLSGEQKGKVPRKKSEWQIQNIDTPNVIQTICLPGIPLLFPEKNKIANVKHVNILVNIKPVKPKIIEHHRSETPKNIYLFLTTVEKYIMILPGGL